MRLVRLALLASLALPLGLAGCSRGPFPGAGSADDPLPAAYSPYLRLSEADVVQAVATVQTGLETAPHGQATSWSNEETGNSGQIVPLRTLQTDTGYYCREYVERLVIDGQEERIVGTACRDDRGVWLRVGAR